MPSAANPNLEKQASTEAGEPIKQAIVMIEHKIRNLEKRKKKIETYKHEQDQGKTLNADQLEAVKKYDEVMHTLTFAQLLSQQFNVLSINHAKQAKKVARREAAERSQQEISKFREALLIQDTLKELITTPAMRADIGTGSSGLPQLTEEELLSLEQWLPLIAPRRDDPPATPVVDENSTPESTLFVDRLHRAAEHLIRVVDSNTRELHGTTYARVKEICQKITESGYLEQNTETPVVQDLNNATTPDESTEELIPASQQDEFSAPSLPGQVINPGIVEAAAPPGLCPPPTPVTNPVLQHPPQAAIPPSIPANAPPQPASGFVEPNAYYQQAPVTAVPPNSSVNQATNNVAPLPTPQPNSTIPATQFVPQARPINEVIGSVGGAFNFLQESELDPPEMTVLLPGVAAPVAGAPLPVAGPIPTQTYTNQNFSQTQPPHPQAPPVAQIHPMVVYQQQQQQAPPLQPQASNVTPANTAQQQQIPPKNMAMVRPLLEEGKTEIEPVQQPTSAPVTTPPLIQSDDWNDTSGDWCQSQDPVTSTGDWNQGSIDDWDNMNSNVQSQSPQERPARMYRGRGGRGSGRGGGGNNSYSGGGGNGGRGGSRGGYQNGRGGGGGGGGYRNNNGDGYYSNQNGYSQGGNGGGGYKRGGGGTRGTGGPPRGNGGPRGGGGRGRGGSNYMRGGGVKPQN